MLAFAPQTQKQFTALLQYVDKNRPAIESRKTAEYKQAVANVREIMRAYFAVNPPKLTAFSPWKHLGTRDMCVQIAEKYSIPIMGYTGRGKPVYLQ
jgi:hypothetical protein